MKKRKLPLSAKMALCCLALAMTSGCTRKVYIPVEHLSTDTLINIRHHTDTIFNRDSIFVDNTDGVRIKEVYRWKERIRTRVDTVYRTRVDSVPVIITAAGNEGDRKVSRWKWLNDSLNSITGYLFAALCGYLILRPSRRE